MKKIILPILLALGLYQATNISTSGTLPTNCSVGNAYIKTGASAGFYICLSTNTWTQVAGAGSGDVTAASNIADNAIVRGDGGAKGIQQTGITIDDSDVIAFPDGVRQTFNPDGTNAGLNFGSQAGDPSSLSNGDCWYNSSATKFKCRQNGSTVDMISTASFTNLLDVKFARKTGTEAVSASSALQDDDHLTIAIGASETWAFDFYLAVAASTEAGDIKVTVNAPSGAAGTQQMVGLQTGTASVVNTVAVFSTTDITDTGIGSFGVDDTVGSTIQMHVLIVNSTNAGNVKLRWAQLSASGSTTLNTNSYVIAWRVN